MTKRLVRSLRGSAIVAAYLIALLSIAFIPIKQSTVTTRGIDAYEYHRPIYGSITQSQDMFVHNDLFGIGALLVPFGKSSERTDTQVKITNIATAEVVLETTIPPELIQDDRFAFIEFNTPLEIHNQTIRITISAPTATPDNAVAIRFHPDDVYRPGQRWQRDQEQTGDLAVAVIEKVPAWLALSNLVAQFPQRSQVVAFAIAASLLLGLLSTQLGWHKMPSKPKRIVEITILCVLAGAGLATRWWVIDQLGGVSGGDPYNYLFITQQLSEGENPFAGTKRLPGYPLLLLPAYLTQIDDHTWMRLLGSISGVLTALMTSLVARRLGFAWPVQLATASLLLWQKDFFWVSMRPEAYSVYTLLLVTTIYLFLNLKTLKHQLLFGLVLGYAAMTRQEGFVVAALYGIAALLHLMASWWKNYTTQQIIHTPGDLQKTTPSTRTILRQYTLAFLPAALLVTPFFLNNWIAYGNPLYTPYFEGERLQIVNSWATFIDASGATWGVLGSMWRIHWDQLERIPLNSPILALTILLTIGWWAYHRFFHNQSRTLFPPLILTTIALCGGIAITLAATASSGQFQTIASHLTAGLILVSPFLFIAATQWRGLLIVVIGLSQILIATWFHPFAKHYQQAYPLIILAIATILMINQPASRRPETRLSGTFAHTALFLIFALVTFMLFQPSRIRVYIDDHNHQTALDSVVYRALQSAQQLPGPVGIDQAYLPARLYFGGQAYYYGEENSDPVKEAQWLATNPIKTIVVTNLNPTFMSLPSDWQLISHHKAEGKDERLLESFVYTLSSQQ